jgi:hypothetical protein
MFALLPLALIGGAYRHVIGGDLLVVLAPYDLVSSAPPRAASADRLCG